MARARSTVLRSSSPGFEPTAKSLPELENERVSTVILARGSPAEESDQEHDDDDDDNDGRAAQFSRFQSRFATLPERGRSTKPRPGGRPLLRNGST